MTKTPTKTARKTAFVSKRGRPTSSQVIAIDKVILDEACAIFLEQGYGNASMEAVATKTGVSKGTLYARYGDKAALFNAVVSSRLNKWKAAAPSNGKPPADVAEVLLRFGVAFLDRMRDPEIGAFHHMILGEADRFPELARQFYHSGYAGAIERLAAELDLLALQAGWPITDARSLARTFLSALLGWFDSESLAERISDTECKAYVVRLTALLVGGRSAW